MAIVPLKEGEVASVVVPSVTDGPTSAPLKTTSAKPEGFGEIIDAVARNHEGIGHLVDRLGAQFTRARDAEMSISKTFAWMVFAFMIGTVIVCAVLVYFERMSDGALTFLLGVMVAYMMRFIDRLDFGGGDG